MEKKRNYNFKAKNESISHCIVRVYNLQFAIFEQKTNFHYSCLLIATSLWITSLEGFVEMIGLTNDSSYSRSYKSTIAMIF